MSGASWKFSAAVLFKSEDAGHGFRGVRTRVSFWCWLIGTELPGIGNALHKLAQRCTRGWNEWLSINFPSICQQVNLCLIVNETKKNIFFSCCGCVQRACRARIINL